MRDDILWPLIVRNLLHEASGDEQARLSNWAQENRDHQRLLDEVSRIWTAAEFKIATPEIDGEADWQRLKSAIETSISSQSASLPIQLLRSVPFRIAALIVLAVSALIYYWVAPSHPAISTDSLSFETRDSVKRFFLPDSSTLWLNTRSKISFEKSFAPRDVQLEGEAFFDVVPDSARSFTVATQATRTTVIGTSFNVKSNSTDSSVEVTVLKGQVSLSEAKQGSPNVSLKPLDKGSISKKENGVRVSHVTDFSFLRWRTVNNPVYNNEKSRPLVFLANHFDLKKNKLNQTVITGEIANRASLASYANITLKIVYVTSQKKRRETSVVLLSHGKLDPGATYKYKQPLFDIFSKKSEVKIVIDHAEVRN